MHQLLFQCEKKTDHQSSKMNNDKQERERESNHRHVRTLYRRAIVSSSDMTSAVSLNMLTASRLAPLCTSVSTVRYYRTWMSVKMKTNDSNWVKIRDFLEGKAGSVDKL